MQDQIEKVKNHLKKNKKFYLIGGGCFVGGLLIAPKQVVIVDALKGIQWKSPAANQVTTVLARRGHPGNIVMCNETGELFASQRRAGEVMGLNHRDISANVAGNTDSVKGYTFTKIGEAA